MVTPSVVPPTPARDGLDRPVATPAVSVVVPVYRGERHLEATMRSVLEQTFTDFELVVLDNASPDRSGEIAASFEDPRVRIERNPETVPAAQNWNLAIRHARAPLVKLLCADDLLHPRCLEVQVRAMVDDPRLAMVVSRQHIVDEHGQVVAPRRFVRGLVGVHGHRAVVRRVVRSGANPLGAPAGVTFRRSAFDATVGLRQDWFFLGDLDLYTRLIAEGPMLGTRECLASFRVATGTISSQGGRAGYDLQRRFTRELGEAMADGGAVARWDSAVGAVNAPLGRVRRHLVFFAGRQLGRRHRRAG